MNPVLASEVPDGDDGSGSAAVELRAVEAGYSAEAVLRGIDLDVAVGEVVALLGPSGCGKTTLLRAIAGFVRPSVGTIRLAGTTADAPGSHLPPEKRNVGLVPQEGALFPHMDVASNVGFGLDRMSRADRRARVAECLALVGLDGAERRRPEELSGGQQQRVALARALAPRPAVVMLDEPFSALDATLRAQLRDDVRSVLRTAGATAILVTHDQEEALSFAERVAVMRDGRLAQVADPVSLYRHPADLGVAEFVGESVRLDGVVAGGVVRCALGDLDFEQSPRDDLVPLAEGDDVAVVLRPEQVALRPIDDVTHGAQVMSCTYFGHDALVRLRLERGMRPDGSHLTDAPPGIEVLARIHRARLPEVGSRVGVRVEGPVAAFAHE